MFPRVSMAEKRIEGIGGGQLSVMASRFLLSPAAKLGWIKFTGIGPPRLSFSKVVRPYTSTLAACPPSPDLPSAFRGPRRRRVENVCGAHFEAQWGYDGSQKISHDVSMMFPWQRKRLMMTHSYN
jgi:hypothetical protein